jgi:hypothetical protein
MNQPQEKKRGEMGMDMKPLQSMQPVFNGKISGKGIKPLKTPLYKDDILLSQMTNNLRRVGIDVKPGVVNTDGSLVIQPGLSVKHDKAGKKITFMVEAGDKGLVKYEIGKNEKGETLSNMPDHKTVFEDAIKFIDRTIQKAKEANNILAKADLQDVDSVYSAIHRKTYK